MTRAQLLDLLAALHAGRPDGGRSLLPIAYVRSAMTDAQLGQHFASLYSTLKGQEKARMLRIFAVRVLGHPAPVPAVSAAA